MSFSPGGRNVIHVDTLDSMRNVGVPESIDTSVRGKLGFFQRLLDRSCLVRAFPPTSVAPHK
jgi:hypothetical protein